MVEQDYIMRIIRDIVRALMKALLNKDIDEVEVELKESQSTAGQLLRELTEMADQGDINGAENLLYDRLDPADMQIFVAAMQFYLHINEYDEEYLEACDYSREEIKDGISDVSGQYGLVIDDSLMNLL